MAAVLRYRGFLFEKNGHFAKLVYNKQIKGIIVKRRKTSYE